MRSHCASRTSLLTRRYVESVVDRRPASGGIEAHRAPKIGRCARVFVAPFLRRGTRRRRLGQTHRSNQSQLHRQTRHGTRNALPVSAARRHEAGELPPRRSVGCRRRYPRRIESLFALARRDLSADNGRALLIPQGFAHGFQVLSDDAELLYCHSSAYNAAAEGGLNPQDPMLAISWPQQISEMSLRDTQHPMLTEEFAGVAL